jgi:two-component system, OmpR family, phosphate regulon sensor histidine kinase PhoR
MKSETPHLQELLASLPKPIVTHIQHLERMRQDFVANVSHELRTPLTVVQGYLELLLEQTASEGIAKEVLKQMQQQTMRMGSLVEDLLLLSRLEDHYPSNKQQKPIAVFKLLTHIIHEANCLSGASHILDCQLDASLCLRGAEGEIRSLFSNLIFNAVNYTPAGGNIRIRWYQKREAAYFIVEDDGIGIAAKHIPRLTERFYRVDKARSRSSGGTGLGLAIAKHVLIRHDATLKVRSQLGKGSCFICRFPKKRVLVKELCKKIGNPSLKKLLPLPQSC